MSKYEQPFDLYALDSSYVLVGILAYNKLQWNRKCYEPGIFSIELNSSQQYSREWKYVYSPDRRELGIISQVNMAFKKGTTSVTISGKFLEAELDRMIVYPKPKYFYSAEHDTYTSILPGNPDWLTPPGNPNAAEAAMAFFNGFKSISYMGYDVEDTTGQTLVERSFSLDIEAGTIDTDHGTYKNSEHHRNGEALGHKIGLVLKPSHAFFTVDYNYETNAKVFNVRHGRDLTAANEDGNNPVVFSSQNGTIAEGGIVTSDTETKDAVISWQTDESITMVFVNAHTDAVGRFMSRETLPELTDYAYDQPYRVAINTDARNDLREHEDKLNLSFSAFDGSYDYMIDFDIGDIVSVEIPEIGLSADVQIVGCFETVQNGVWSLDMEFGDPLKGGKK